MGLWASACFLWSSPRSLCDNGAIMKTPVLTIIVATLTPLILGCLALALKVHATCQEGCLTNDNTVLGDDALLNNTGSDNTAIGFQALITNTDGDNNTAIGSEALSGNTAGFDNVAVGIDALKSNTIGFVNTAIGYQALQSNTNGDGNVAIGNSALHFNTLGISNTAIGNGALADNTTGQFNTASGNAALSDNTTGGGNVAIGNVALVENTTGDSNIAIGEEAGRRLHTGSNNIYIGNPGGESHNESGTIRIGTVGTHGLAYLAGIFGVTIGSGVPVIVNSNGRLGTVTSSARYKENIQPMDKSSEAILALQSVTFRYKKELDPEATPQFGLVAEEVAKVDPKLVARDKEGKPNTVRYEAVNAMLLNEFLKEHKKVEA